MESNKDRSIATQVAFKGAIDYAVGADLDLANADGQARFEETFSYLTESLFKAISNQLSEDEQAANVVRGAFPGTTTVTGGAQPPTAAPELTVKGEQYAAIPDWMYEAAAKKGVTEVWDNRREAQASDKNRPWFRSTTPGPDGKPVPFWPPRS